MTVMGAGSGFDGVQAVRIVEICDAFASVAIAPDIGGSLLWFRSTGGDRTIDWLRPADAGALAARDPAGMACFPLVPFSNRIRDGRFEFDGQVVQLPAKLPHDPHFEHGHGWRRPWIVAACDASRAVLRYRHEPDQWPWRYEAEQEIALADGALEIRLTLRNLAETAMPFGFGLHPYFPADGAPRIETDAAAMWETDAEVLPTRLVRRADRRQAIEVAGSNLDNVFAGWSRHARLVWPERRLDIEADAPLDFLVLYTPSGEPYFCAEPVSNATDAFNFSPEQRGEAGHRVLEPGASCAATVRFIPRAIV